MKVLLYGKNGWIGEKVYSLLIQKGHSVIIGNARAENSESLEEEITAIQPTNIISTIGRTHGKIGDKEYTTIDYLEQPGKVKENVRDNLFSPVMIALISQKYSIHYAYLGTGCIFTYDSEHPFAEELNGFTTDSKPNFFGSSYSIVKGYTDMLMKAFDYVLNVRIRMPITDEIHPRNFITKITRYQKICSIHNSMSVLPELLPFMIDMCEKGTTGTINLTNPGLISHNEILEMYREIVDANFEWENFDIEEQRKILESERSNNFLDTSRLESMYKVKYIKDAVRDVLYCMKEKEKEKEKEKGTEV
jgi:nucleoside-diphosphate-sugar epimerase